MPESASRALAKEADTDIWNFLPQNDRNYDDLGFDYVG